MEFDTEHAATGKTVPPSGPPALEPGDRLSRDEFELRYAGTPRVKKAELIEGVVYVPSPVRLRRHGRPHAHMIAWLGTYEAATPGVITTDNTSDRLDPYNEPQPDAALFVDPALGGQARISEDDYLEGAPELVGEITSSTVSYDLGNKLDVYRRNGVREYIVWRVLDRALDWFVLRHSVYERLGANGDGIIASEWFPGLWLDVDALLAGDLARVLATVQQGTSSPEHANFVTQLRSRKV